MRIIANILIILFFIFTRFASAAAYESGISTEAQWNLKTPITTLMKCRQQKTLYALSTDPIEKFARMVGNNEYEVVNKNIVVDK